MKNMILVIVILLRTASIVAYSGDELLADCKEAINLADSRIGTGSLAVSLCSGYV